MIKNCLKVYKKTKRRIRMSRIHKGSAPSPNATDENVQNINVTVTNSEDNQDNTQEAIPASELQVTDDNDNSQQENSQSAQCQQENDQQKIKQQENDQQKIEQQENDQQKIEQQENDQPQKIEQQENDQQENHEEAFESEYVNNKNSSETNIIENNKQSQERSHTPDSKPPEEGAQGKKHITLKRSPSHQRRSSSPLEDGEIKEPQEKSKKITLKRHTSDDGNSDFINKIVINRRASSGDDKVDKKRRQSLEERTHIVIARPTKLAKPVKLKRQISSPENNESLLRPRINKTPWGKTNWLENISATSYKIDVDSIKIVCPVVEFLNESEVKLDCIPRERTKSENEPVTKKVEEEEKTEDESEREHTEEEESPEEQKIEAKPNIIALNRKISIVEDTAAKLQPPPSPAKNPVSEILYITNLVRPFTLKQLKELLERTGKIKEGGFWTDRIKSKCYVQYETIEQAETTRNALHGINWPIGNGKQLVIDYATEDDMEKAKNPVSLPSPAIPEKFPQKENRAPEVVENRNRDREREEEKEPEKEERRWEPSEREWNKSRDHHRKHSRSPSRGRDRERARKHSRKSYTPEDIGRKKHKKQDDSVPQKLMDDLFLKTKTTPSIYWQPLSPQEIATKQQQRLVRMEEHKRRIEENKGRFKERDRRGTYRRR
ncbi:apoptotic chromatin condensation inducer in the nucleus-like isoform X2 [Diorhabda sublineata]|uniref:apoptotic chromatin condensation inducer in the nucleus-like isoform X2 n=1 Tax=Diorhabda sublineata TaxID=1163346 RepID=UPI0024E09A96|nr:apoptotic chromatin condensation inducer in the nucleus-like isoform X2 [Diorhabda sublineata]